jgi:hypothetical protein
MAGHLFFIYLFMFLQPHKTQLRAVYGFFVPERPVMPLATGLGPPIKTNIAFRRCDITYIPLIH